MRINLKNNIVITPLNNYNGTPKGRLNRDLRATLPINELKGKPLEAVCPILNVYRCKLYKFFLVNNIENDFYIIFIIYNSVFYGKKTIYYKFKSSNM
jgi:hypothetical protein